MRILARVLIACTLVCGTASAADTETERIAKATEQFAKCLDNTLGNFANEEETQVAARRISQAMLRNVRALIVEERKKPSQTTRFWIETLGEEAFVGYLFKSFSDVTEEYRGETKSLKEKNGFDWRRVHQLLWSKYGCDAIYSQLAR